MGNFCSVYNKTPGRSYVLVGHDQLTLGKYRAMGYKPERWNFKKSRPGAPAHKVREGLELDDCGMPIPVNAYSGVVMEEHRDGEQVSFQGHTLMSIPAAKKQEIEMNGAPWADGTTGQRGADELYESIIKERHYKDAMRGIDPTHARVMLASVDGHQHNEVTEEYLRG